MVEVSITISNSFFLSILSEEDVFPVDKCDSIMESNYHPRF